MGVTDSKSWLVAAVAALAGVAPAAVDPRRAFARYGVDSAAIVAMATRLGEHLGRPVAPVLFWRHSTIEALAAALDRGEDAAPAAPAALARRPASDHQPIAVVGMACRMPGAPDLGAFWDLLRAGRHGITDLSPARWTVGSSDQGVPGRAGLLDDVVGFDAEFFGISPREAAELDPQQRLALELGWEALEDAGISPRGLVGTRTGVFVGAVWRDYAVLAGRASGRANVHTATGQALNMVANRISYLLGLQGPSLVIDSACSSSLVAVHLACQSLWSGESDRALVGGINLMLAPETMVALTRFGGLAPDGLCKAFDARADGFGRGEGGGVVVLQPLDQAIAQGARVYAVIRASAVNNDGPSNGLTAPNPAAQEALLRRVYGAELPAASIGYVEAHGTGTALGDPIEASALGAVLGLGRAPGAALRVGTVKTNIGHLEGAAGIAGFIKAALCVHRGEVVPNLQFENPNPLIPLAELGLTVPLAAEPWPGPRPARAGVSSFGWGGTNAHVVLEEAPARPVRTIAIAAEGEAERADAVRAALDALPTASSERGAGRFRVAVVGRSDEELRAGLEAFLAGQPRPGLAAGVADEQARVAFVFSPQGGQSVGCGLPAMASEPAFAAALAAVDELWTEASGWSIREALSDPALSARIDEVDVAQPILFAIQVALVDTWAALGVVPDIVIGHSCGELAACYAAGVLDLADVVRLMHHYTRVQLPIKGRGAMMVAERSPEELREVLAASEGRLVIAGENGPRSTVLSGPPADVAAGLARLRAEGALCAPIRVNIAAHGPDCREITDELIASVTGLRGRRARCLLMSTTRVAPLAGPEVDIHYFVQNLHDPVRLAPVIDQILDDGVAALVEIGPNPVLLPALRQAIAHRGSSAVALGSLERADEALALHETRARLFCRGLVRPVDAASELVALSAGTAAGLRQLAGATAAQLAAGDRALADVARAAGEGRAHHAHRLGAIASSVEELDEALRGFARRGEHESVETGVAGREPVPVAFVFPGQGSQWLGMARELLATQPRFRAALAACDAAVAALVGWSVLDEIAFDEGRSNLGRIDVVQPTLFSIQVALAAQWRAWGIEPALVIGHSMGEVAAAHVAGILSLEDAVRIICLRSRLLRSVSGKGAMLICELTMAEAAEVVRGAESLVSIAVSNSSRSTVLSGDPGQLTEIGRLLEERKVFWRWVKVDVASHSPQMDPLREDLLAALDGIAPREGSIAMASTVDDAMAEGAAMDGRYWVRNLREPVLFASAIQRAAELGIGAFVELSPHPILLPAVEQELADTGQAGVALGSLRRGAPERPALLRSLAALYALGHAPRWTEVAAARGRHVSLPAYPWQREPYWLEEADEEERAPRGSSSAHPLLGEWIPLAGVEGGHVWSTEWDRSVVALFDDHVIDGDVVAPGAVFVEMMLAAGAQALGRLDLDLVDVGFERALTVEPRQRTWVQTVLAPVAGTDEHRVEVFTREGASWIRHAGGRLRPFVEAPIEATPDADGSGELVRLDGAAYYQWLAGRGLEYGPAFRGIQEVVARPGEVTARFEVPATADDRLVCDPRFLDVALQASAGLLLDPTIGAGPHDGVVSVAIGAVELGGAAVGPALSRVRLRAREAGALVVDVEVTTPDGDRILRAAGMRLVHTPRAERPTRASREADAGLASELAAVDPAEREGRLEAAVREIAARVLRLAPDRIRRDVPLRELGMDSILSLEMRNRLATRTGLRLPATLLWNHPTLVALAGFLLERLELPAVPVVVTEAARPAATAPPPAMSPPEASPARQLLADELALVERMLQGGAA